MNIRKSLVILTVLGLLVGGVWFFNRAANSTQTAADPRLTGRAQVPAGGDLWDTSVPPASESYDPIEPVVVHMTDLPAGDDGQSGPYQRWLRGEEVDLGESEYRVSEREMADLQLEALQMPPSPNVQIAGSSPSPNAPILGTSFDSLDYIDAFSNYVPPDSYLAVGPSHIIAVVNSTFEVYDKM
ncbi:MAG: hypothetical protein GY803_12975, partial [Chloroflexi bacterium]|nr:hypothetical protein [Chloroflexota bacterium]